MANMSRAPRPRRRACRRTVAVGIVSLLVLAGVNPPSHASTPAPTTPLLGVYDGNQGWAMQEVRDLEQWQGRKNAVVELFTSWDGSRKVMDNLFGQQLPAIWANGNVPLITWEPFLPRSTPADIEVRIARGDHDAYIRTWATRLGAFLAGPDGTNGTGDDRRVYLRFAHEMNGDWYPWSGAVGGNDPSSYKAMWQRVHGLVTSASGAASDQLQWMWTVNHTDVGSFTAEQYYPDDKFVDWVGIDGYNWGATQSWSTWQSPAQTLGPMLKRLRNLASTKPVSISEVATTSVFTGGGVDLAAKSAWIAELFSWVRANGVGMVVWFNEDKETDWAAFGGARGDVTIRSGRTTYRGYAAYATAVRNGFTYGSTTDAGRITDAQFRGT